MNKDKLLGKIKEHGKTIEGFAKELGLSNSSMYRKVNGKSQFTREEIKRIASILELDNGELLEIFFTS